VTGERERERERDRERERLVWRGTYLLDGDGVLVNPPGVVVGRGADEGIRDLGLSRELGLRDGRPVRCDRSRRGGVGLGQIKRGEMVSHEGEQRLDAVGRGGKTGKRTC
jgi:hypothetical protein